MGKLNFNLGITAVQAGQKANTLNAEPRLIANSTLGKFTITSRVSKAMDIAVGENIQFFNNATNLEKAINEKNTMVIEGAASLGYDVNDAAQRAKFIIECAEWFIAKGHQQFDAKGDPIMVKARCTKEDKLAVIEAKGAELIANDAFRSILIERVGDEDASDEELIAAITVDDIDSPEVVSYTGSKTATSGNATGVGCQLSFTDTAIWSALKQDLSKDEKIGVNRIFKVDLDNPIHTQVNDGHKLVDVTAYMISFIEDAEPIDRMTKTDDSAE